MSGVRDWQGRTGDAWAAEWRRTDRVFAGLTERLLARTRDFDFVKVLDIGCGAGELSLAIARGRPAVQVTGLDISPRLVATARERGANLGNVEFVAGNAAVWQPDEDFAPDLLVSRHGVMFFDDPVAAFAHLHALAAPGAGLLFSCFRGPEVNEMISGFTKLLPPPAEPRDPDAPGPLAFADPDRVKGILADAGWRRATFEPVDFATVVGAGEDPVADAVAFFSTIGPLAEAISQMEFAERDELLRRLSDVLAPRVVDGVIALRAGAWLVTAQKGPGEG